MRILAAPAAFFLVACEEPTGPSEAAPLSAAAEMESVLDLPDGGMIGLSPELASRFAPDFYLPDVNLWVELTTIRQALMRQKRRKLRRFATLYPDLRIKLLGASDIKALMWKYQRSARGVVGPSGSATPPRTRRERVGEAAA
jgi:hypothetical protein